MKFREEKFIKGKYPDESKCEDIIVDTPHFSAVIDGVTSKHGALIEGKTGGRYAAEVVAKTLDTLDEKADAYTAFSKINSAIKEACEKYSLELKKHLQACAIIYSKYRKEIWNYGDCALMINGKSYRHEKPIDNILGGLRAFVITSYLNEGGNPDDLYEKDIGREAILPYLKKQSDFANAEGYFGYPVLNGDKVVEEYILKYKVNVGDCVVLASDGYPLQYEKGLPIEGLEEFKKHDGYYCFHAGTKFQNEQLVTNGGRVLGVTAKGATLKEARANAYAATEWVNLGNKYMRTDIGKAIDEA